MHAVKRVCMTLATIAVACLCHLPAAQAITVNPGQTLQVTFSESGPESVTCCTGAGGRAVDTLEFSESNVPAPPISAVATLYDGSTLLGTVDFSAFVFQTFGFTAPGSAYTFESNGQVSDWNSLIAGNINGILDITFSSPIDVTIGLVGIGVGTSSNGFADATNQPTILKEAVLSATPLPPSWPLFAGGLGLVGLLAWWQRRKPSLAIA